MYIYVRYVPVCILVYTCFILHLIIPSTHFPTLSEFSQCHATLAASSGSPQSETGQHNTPTVPPARPSFLTKFTNTQTPALGLVMFFHINTDGKLQTKVRFMEIWYGNLHANM